MDPQFVTFYVTIVAALTSKMRPIWRYPVVFMITVAGFLMGMIALTWLVNDLHEALTSVRWFFMPRGGLLILIGLGACGCFFVWIAFLFNPSDDLAQKPAINVPWKIGGNSKQTETTESHNSLADKFSDWDAHRMKSKPRDSLTGKATQAATSNNSAPEDLSKNK